MGLFDAWKKTVSHVVTKPANLILSGLEKVTGKKYGRTSASEFAATPFGHKLSLATAVPATALGATLATTSFAKTAAKKAIPATGKALFGSPKKAATTVFAGGVLAASPSVRQEAKALPKTLFSTGKTVGTAIEKTSQKKKTSSLAAKALTLGTGAALAAGAIAVAPKVLDKAKNLLPSPKPKEPTITVMDAATGQVLAQTPIQPSPVTTTPPGAIKKTPSKPRRRKKKQKPISVSQKVNVNVSNKMTRRFINQQNLIR